ncbi:MAG: FISUMP domain-containing protein [Cyclobacteriaceae bacterium]
MKKLILLLSVIVIISFFACSLSAQTFAVIGNQTWDVKNLSVTTFANGDKIDQAQSDEEWVKAGKEGRPAWCYYEGNAENGKIYGLLYNFYAVERSTEVLHPKAGTYQPKLNG